MVCGAYRDNANVAKLASKISKKVIFPKPATVITIMVTNK